MLLGRREICRQNRYWRFERRRSISRARDGSNPPSDRERCPRGQRFERQAARLQVKRLDPKPLAVRSPSRVEVNFTPPFSL